MLEQFVAPIIARVVNVDKTYFGLISRGHYDTVILNPEFVAAHPAATVTNRDIRTTRDETIAPFQAVVEFRLDNKGWSAGRCRGAIAELGKLRLSDEAPLRYFGLDKILRSQPRSMEQVLVPGKAGCREAGRGGKRICRAAVERQRRDRGIPLWKLAVEVEGPAMKAISHAGRKLDMA